MALKSGRYGVNIDEVDEFGNLVRVDEVTAKLSQLDDNSLDETVSFTIVANSYVSQDGYFGNYNGWSRTDYIDVSKYSSLKVSMSSPDRYNCFWDENYKLVEDIILTSTESEIAVPPNAKYVAFSQGNSVMATFSLKGSGLKGTVNKVIQELSTLTPKTYSATGINATLTTNRVVKSGHTVTLDLEFKLATSTGTATNLASLPFTLPTNIGGLMVCNSDGSFYSIGYMTTNGHVHSLKTLNLNTTYEITGTIIVNE